MQIFPRLFYHIFLKCNILLQQVSRLFVLLLIKVLFFSCLISNFGILFYFASLSYFCIITVLFYGSSPLNPCKTLLESYLF